MYKMVIVHYTCIFTSNYFISGKKHAGRQNTFNKHKQDICFDSWNYWGGRLGLWCLMPLSTVFQLYIVINDKTNCFLENAEIRKKELFFFEEINLWNLFMPRYTYRYVAEILLKLMLNTNQSVNQAIQNVNICHLFQ
jgi:hypothetical protein